MNLARREGDARTLMDASVELSRELGSKRPIIGPLRALGRAARTEGNYEEARSHLNEALASPFGLLRLGLGDLLTHEYPAVAAFDAPACRCRQGGGRHCLSGAQAETGMMPGAPHRVVDH